MSLPSDRAEAHARDLARFQALAMAAAEKAGAAIAATEDPETLCDLMGALAKAGRVLRMSIALEAKLARDAARQDREAGELRAATAARAVEARKARLAAEVDRMIWTELDIEDADVATAELHERLETEALLDGFADEPIEAQVERLARQLDLTGEATERYIPAALRRRHARRLRDDWYDNEDDAEDDPEDEAAGSAAAAHLAAHLTALNQARIADSS